MITNAAIPEEGILFVFPTPQRVMLASNSTKISERAIIQALADKFGGGGGGNEQIAQGKLKNHSPKMN